VRIKENCIEEFKRDFSSIFPEVLDLNDSVINLSSNSFYETYSKLDSILSKYSSHLFYPHIESEVTFDDSVASEFFLMPSVDKRELFMLVEKHGILPKKHFL
jgi:hypothetical protein